MKKAVFYSMVRENGKNIAKKHDGWTDGIYNYYKTDTGRTWFAIHPAVGLSVSTGSTRKEASESAHAPGMAERVAAALDRMGERAKDAFIDARIAAKEAAA